MIEFKIKCYPDSNCECNLTVKIGKLSEVAPNDTNFDPETTYGFDITTDREHVYGYSHIGFKDFYQAQKSAMLRAVSYGNGGFPLEFI